MHWPRVKGSLAVWLVLPHTGQGRRGAFPSQKVLLASAGADPRSGLISPAMLHCLMLYYKNVKEYSPFWGRKTYFSKNFAAIFSLQKSCKRSTESGFPEQSESKCHPGARNPQLF